MTLGIPSLPLHGEISRCECGAESPGATTELVDAWEDDHAQWECPIDTSPEWDEVMERWAYPRFPGFTRRSAPVEDTTDDTPPSWSRHRLRSHAMRAWLNRHRKDRP